MLNHRENKSVIANYFLFWAFLAAAAGAAGILYEITTI